MPGLPTAGSASADRAGLGSFWQVSRPPGRHVDAREAAAGRQHVSRLLLLQTEEGRPSLSSCPRHARLRPRAEHRPTRRVSRPARRGEDCLARCPGRPRQRLEWPQHTSRSTRRARGSVSRPRAFEFLFSSFLRLWALGHTLNAAASPRWTHTGRKMSDGGEGRTRNRTMDRARSSSASMTAVRGQLNWVGEVLERADRWFSFGGPTWPAGGGAVHLRMSRSARPRLHATTAHGG
ncbi:hypothetical protein B0T11DRAFT_269324 [Plectosphaerella cucumerina]|uniref:Uncharacterized protein n=1 Tax=Plectosphaerella cucumerina TaxID=40658 RepID=A0A8K0TUG2_9PEZI|nr:hypothetical protein B0T11DRAFT_269324 [Plectosphaerella cucumerina]